MKVRRWGGDSNTVKCMVYGDGEEGHVVVSKCDGDMR